MPRRKRVNRPTVYWTGKGALDRTAELTAWAGAVTVFGADWALGWRLLAARLAGLLTWATQALHREWCQKCEHGQM